MDKIKTFLFENLYTGQIIAKNAFWLYASEFISKCLRLIVFLLVTRSLGPTNYGILEYFLSFVGLFFIFADFGISGIFIRDYQQKEEKDKLVTTAFFLKIFLSFLFAVISLFGFFYSKKFDGFWLYLIFVIFYTLQEIENFFGTYFIASQKTERKFIFDVLSAFNLLFLVSLFLALKIKNIFFIGLAYLISMLSGLILAYYFFGKEFRIYLKNFNFGLIKHYLYNGSALALFGLLSYIFFATDKIFISHFRGAEETGYYALASRIVNTLFSIVSILNIALYPVIAKKVKEDKIFIRKLFPLIVIGLLLIGLFLALLTIIVSPFIIPLVFGEKYLNSIPIFQLLVLAIILLYPTNFLDFFLISNNRQWLDFGLTTIPAILNIVLNLILIPLYGMIGAVYATLISQLINFLLTLSASVYILKRDLSK